jgi:hypothetical protein
MGGFVMQLDENLVDLSRGGRNSSQVLKKNLQEDAYLARGMFSVPKGFLKGFNDALN